MGSKPTQLWPGQRMRAFFRSIFREESGVSDELADRLAEVCERHINRMLVWDGEPVKIREPAPNISRDAAVAVAPEAIANGVVDRAVDEMAGAPSPDPIDDVATTEAGAPWPVAHLDETEPSEDSVGSDDGSPAFDPFAFSVVVILARSGVDALRTKLKGIRAAEDLRELADAQHLGVDPDLRGDAGALRRAIVRGAKQRLADRRAAAS